MIYSGIIIGGPLAGQRGDSSTPYLCQGIFPKEVREASSAPVSEDCELSVFSYHFIQTKYEQNKDERARFVHGIWVPSDKDLQWALDEMFAVYSKEVNCA